MGEKQLRGHDTGLNGSVAAALRAERAAQNLTIEQLAALSGVPAVTVQRLLAARRVITMETLEDLCRALRVSPTEVITRAEERAGRADPELVARALDGIRSSAGRDVTQPT